MSDTPRTDEKAFGKKVMEHEMVAADFARELERENAELRHTVELLEDKNEVLTIRPRGDVERENALLRQDKERLDWLLREYNICRFGYQRLARSDIDEAMKGE